MPRLYFLPTQCTQSGIFFLANRLYGITFRNVVPVRYHPEATAYEVLADLDADPASACSYFDYFPRREESGWAATTSSRSTQTARASRSWCRSSVTSIRPAGGVRAADASTRRRRLPRISAMRSTSSSTT